MGKIVVIKPPHKLIAMIRIKLFRLTSIGDAKGISAYSNSFLQTDWCVSVSGNQRLLAILLKKSRLAVVFSPSFCSGLWGLGRASYHIFEIQQDPGSQLLKYHTTSTLSPRILGCCKLIASWLPHTQSVHRMNTVHQGIGKSHGRGEWYY